MEKIPLIRPYINETIKNKVLEVLESGFLTEGAVTKEFEEAFKRYIGCNHAIAVTSCTTGLEIALRVLGVAPGDEVIVPDYTYPATADVVTIVGANIVIVDVSTDTMLIDYNTIEEAITPNTKVIIPVSLFGNPLDYEKLASIKQKYNINIIEDAACAIGAEYKGVKVGNLADISVFSLHPRKFITTGEGGMITTNNSKWADWMDSYKHFGMGVHHSQQETVFERIGSNYKLSNVLSAIGLGQMVYIHQLLEQRRKLSDNYIHLLENCKAIRIPKTTEGGIHSYQSFCVFIEDRDKIMQSMRAQGIEVQIGTYSLHMHPAFVPSPFCEIKGDMAGSRYAFEHCLVLPLYHDLPLDDQVYIVEELTKRL